MHFKCVYLLVGLACLAAAVPAMGLVVIDHFSDGDYTNNPTWTVTSGSIDASGGELAFGTASGTTITLDFPALDNTPVSVSYRLHQSNGSAGNFGFDTYMVDTDTGLFHVEYACTNPVCFGPSGFHSWISDGSNFTAALPAAIGRSVAEAWPGYVEMKMIFDPVTGVEFYFEGVLMALWPNFHAAAGMNKVNQIKLVNGNGTLSWFVDDVVVSSSIVAGGPAFCGAEGTVFPEGDITGVNNVPDCFVDVLDLELMASEFLSCTDPENVDCESGGHLTTLRDYRAIQTIYRNGVPHTDKNGNRRTTYAAGVSFFPIGILNAPRPGPGPDDWNDLVDGNFNTVWTWPLMSAPDSLQAGADFNLQIIIMNPVDSTTLTSIKDHSNLLGNMWRDEPPVDFPDAQTFMDDFIAYRDMAHSIAPQMPVFSVLVPNLTPAWTTWNQIMDVACHDNYPILPVTPTIGATSSDIPLTVLLSAEITDEQKPVWFVPENFQWANAPDHNFPFRLPTVEQVRAQVYAAIIHGATGIHYFVWDTWLARVGAVIGMSPDPRPTLLNPPATPATPMQMNRSLAVWLATKQLNSELTTLTPAILSPTASAVVGYSVALTGQDVTDAPVRCILKQDPAGGYMLLTVNVDEAVIEAIYTFDSELASVEPLFENRLALNLTAGSHSFSQNYDPFEAHIFHIDLVP